MDITLVKEEIKSEEHNFDLNDSRNSRNLSTGDTSKMKIETLNVDFNLVQKTEQCKKQLDVDIKKAVSRKEKSSNDGINVKKTKQDKFVPTGISCHSLWISNISPTTNANDIKNLLSKYGKVTVAKIVQNVQFKRLCAYAIMETREAVDLCVKKLNKSELKGKLIGIVKSKYRLPLNVIIRNKNNLSEKFRFYDKTVKKKTVVSSNNSKPKECSGKTKKNKTSERQMGCKNEILTFDKVKERASHRNRDLKHTRERSLKEAEERKRRRERELIRETQNRHRVELERLERQRQKLRNERENLDRLRAEILRFQRERRNEIEKVKTEQVELKRQQMLLEKARRSMKISVSSPRSNFKNDNNSCSNSRKFKVDRHDRISPPSRLERESSFERHHVSLLKKPLESYDHHSANNVNRGKKRDIYEPRHKQHRQVSNSHEDEGKRNLAEVRPYNTTQKKSNSNIKRKTYPACNYPSEKKFNTISSSTISSTNSFLSEEFHLPKNNSQFSYGTRPEKHVSVEKTKNIQKNNFYPYDALSLTTYSGNSNSSKYSSCFPRNSYHSYNVPERRTSITGRVSNPQFIIGAGNSITAFKQNPFEMSNSHSHVEKTNFQQSNSQYYGTRPSKLLPDFGSHTMSPKRNSIAEATYYLNNTQQSYGTPFVKPFSNDINSSKTTLQKPVTWISTQTNSNVNRNISNLFFDICHLQQNTSNHSGRRFDNYNNGRKY